MRQGDSRPRLTPAEKAAQDFIIAASRNREDAIARTFVGKMRLGVEGKTDCVKVSLDSSHEPHTVTENCSEGALGVLVQAAPSCAPVVTTPSDSYVARNPVGESGDKHLLGDVPGLSCRVHNQQNSYVQHSQTTCVLDKGS